MAFIQNADQLLSAGNVGLRRAAIEIIEYALARVDPYAAVEERVRLVGDCLAVDDFEIQIGPEARIFLIGAGKATFPIARALEDMLGDRITDGVVIAKYGQPGQLEHCRLRLADHPIPDAAGLAAAREALDLAQQTRSGDIVIGCITGGSSALMPLPVGNISLGDKQETNRLLLTCGANIVEINAVRKHLSRIKGGRLAAAIHPEVRLVNLTVSDVIGDPLDYITDPTVPDSSTLDDARDTLDKYDLWPRLPVSVAQLLRTATHDRETPKESDLAGRWRRDVILISAAAACEAAAAKAAEMGFESTILSTAFEGESRELGRTFGAIAKEVTQKGRPFSTPCALIGGGETTVQFDGAAGRGGPNQEFALGAAVEIHDIGPVVVAGLDTDGTDGPTPCAGALVDEGTFQHAARAGLNCFEALRCHDVTPIFRELGDAIITGATGTNVNDLKLMLIGNPNAYRPA